jgi:hypothetical protein
MHNLLIIPYNLFVTTKFNDSSILITIISCDYLNLSLADEHVGDVTIPTQVIEYNKKANQIGSLLQKFFFRGKFRSCTISVGPAENYWVQDLCPAY